MVGLLSSYSVKCREVVYILSILNLSRLKPHSSKYDNMITVIILYLQLPMELMMNKYSNILYTEHSLIDLEDMVSAYIKVIECEQCWVHNIIFDYAFVLNVNKMYTSCSRIFLRSLCELLNIPYLSFVHVEENLRYFIDNGSTKKGDGLHRTGSVHEFSYSDYTRIGTVAVGVGAAAAVAGSLAAPAILLSAVGVVSGVAGPAQAALLASSASFASSVSSAIFGSVGASVAGYKMSRRLRGLSHFEFEPYNEGHLAVCILVPGWLVTDMYDNQRVFGIVPTEMSMRERLIRFFQQHDPERIDEIDALCKKSAADVYSELLEETGWDPMKPEHISPISPAVHISQVLWNHFSELSKINCQYNIESKQTPLHCKEEDVDETSLDVIPRPVQIAGTPSCGAGTHDVKVDTASSFWNYQDWGLSSTHDLVVLKWELELLLQLGDTIPRLIRGMGTNFAIRTALTSTALGALNSSMALPLNLIQITNYIDSVWSLAEHRADLAGHELAMSILEQYENDRRSINLVGFSMGSRVIFSCLTYLRSLCDQSNSNCRVEQMIGDVVLLGSPLSADPLRWEGVRGLVNGRLINGYSTTDVVLQCIYRIEGFNIAAIAGTQAVNSADVENFNLSFLVTHHSDYCIKMKQILSLIGLDEYLIDSFKVQNDPVATEI